MIGSNALYTSLGTCLLCQGSALNEVVPLEPIPIGTPNFVAPSDALLAKSASSGVPLDIFQCSACGHLQVGNFGNPEFQYRDYIYTTGLSLGLPAHFRDYANDVIERYAPPAGALIVEIGSNDGTLLRAFKERGYRVFGVDPARAIAMQATENGVETAPEFFTEAFGTQLADQVGKAHIMIANNMIANVPDLVDYMRGVAALLHPDGVFIFETQYGADVIERNLLDTVYHEHISYFLVKPTRLFLERMGFALIAADRIDTKGGSMRFGVQWIGGRREQAPSVQQLVSEEEQKGVFGAAYYQKLLTDLSDIRTRLQSIAQEVRLGGKTIGGYGVSVGTTALLPQFGIAESLAFLVDDDPRKPRFLDGPNYHIPVVKTEELYAQNAGAVVIFAWRYAESIIAKHERFLEQGGQFVIPLPHVSVVKR